MAAPEAIGEVAGTPTDLETTPALTPEPETTTAVKPDGTMAAQDAERWALGLALERGFTRPDQAQTVRQELIEGTDIPKPARYEEFTAGEQLAYQSAIEAARTEFDARSSQSDHRLQRLEMREQRQSCIDNASGMVSEGARTYLAQAVAQIERDNGNPIPADYPVMRQMIADKAELMFHRAGRKPVGETVPAAASPNLGVPQSVKDEWLPAFEKAGYPGSGPGGKMTDKDLEAELRKMDVSW